MRKIFSFMLIAAGLLISGQAKAVDVAKLADLKTAVETPNAQINITATLTVNSDLDFNGATVTLADGKYLKVSGAKTSEKTYTWKNLTLNANHTYAIYQVTYVTNLILDNVHVENVGKYACYMNVANAKLTLQNGSTLSGKTYQVYAKVNATINNKSDLAKVYVPADKILTINNEAGATLTLGTTEAGQLVVNNEGTCNVTAGTYSQALTFTGTSIVNIAGGTFNAAVEGANMSIAGGTFNEDVTGENVSISGGRFAVKPNDEWLTSDDLQFVKLEGYYQPIDVATTPFVAMNTATGTQYYSLVDAFDAAEDGETIALLKDVTLNTASIMMYGRHAKGARNLTLDLAGHTISRTEAVKPSVELGSSMFYLHEGSLVVTGSGTIQDDAPGENYVFLLSGSNDPEAVNFTSLTIGENVNIISTNGSAITIDGIQKDKAGTREAFFGYTTRDGGNINDAPDGDHAYGVVLDIKGYVQALKYAVKINGLTTQMTGNIPFIHIEDGAVIQAGNDTKSTAIYSAGYGNWQIDKAEISGNTGIYMKAGSLVIDGAKVSSTGEYSEVVAKGSGIDAGGSAIVIESNSSYIGHQHILIKGESEITGNGGYALEEVAKNTGDKCDDFIIEGGTFNNGEKGCITTTGTVKDNVVLNGSITGGVFGENIQDYLSQITGVITPVVDGVDTKYVVGAKPEGTPDWSSDLENANENSYIRLNNDSETTITLDKDVECTYLTASGKDKIVVEAGHTLNIGQLVMNEEASITVKPGAKVIVNGENGIVAFNDENLIIQASADAMGAFVLNPAVESNKTPYATVQYFAKNASSIDTKTKNNKFDIFVSPFVKIDEMSNNISLDKNLPAYGNTMGSWYQVWMGNQWEQHNTAWIKENVVAFQPIAITNTSKYVKGNTDNQVTYTFKGQLQGNTSGIFDLGKGYIYLGNGFVAPMNATKILDQLNDAKIEHNIWVWKNNQFFPIQEDNLATEMPAMGPMCFFVIKTKQPVELNLDYETLIWDFNK